MNEWSIKCFIFVPERVQSVPLLMMITAGVEMTTKTGIWSSKMCVVFFYLKATLITHKTRTVLYLVPKVFRLGIHLSPQAKKLTKKRQFFSVHLSSFLRFVAENYSN